MRKIRRKILVISLILCFLLAGCGQTTSTNKQSSTPIEIEMSGEDTSTTRQEQVETENVQDKEAEVASTDVTSTETTSAVVAVEQEAKVSTISLGDIPAFSGSAYISVNNNVPVFTDEQFTTTSFEEYSELDSMGRCGVAFANVGKDLMPTEDRGSIGAIKPTGWYTVKYDCVDGKYLYNRCHLIGYQLSGENANVKNLITGTRYLNIDGMLPFENMVIDYVKETGNHVLYRVTPIFEGNNLVASGVQMEGKSVEDNGAGILYNIYAYNSQPQIIIDYATGNSSFANGQTEECVTTDSTAAIISDTTQETYILNTNTHKFHKPSCRSVSTIKESNKQEFIGSREELIAQGYEACKNCN